MARSTIRRTLNSCSDTSSKTHAGMSSAPATRQSGRISAVEQRIVFGHLVEARVHYAPLAPQGACFNHTGNIFVVEWVEAGRVTKLRRV
jgi:hypothetical protein